MVQWIVNLYGVLVTYCHQDTSNVGSSASGTTSGEDAPAFWAAIMTCIEQAETLCKLLTISALLTTTSPIVLSNTIFILLRSTPYFL